MDNGISLRLIKKYGYISQGAPHLWNNANELSNQLQVKLALSVPLLLYKANV